MGNKSTHLRILLLEDDTLICDIVTEFLQECGYDVTAVQDGYDAIDRAYESRYDAYVFDIKVPSQSGFDVLRTLRAADKLTPAIFVTSLASIEDMSMGYESGCDDYIKKPFELKELQLRLQKLMRQTFSLGGNGSVVLNPRWAFEPDSGRLFGESGELFLTRKESRVLKALLMRRGQVVPREEILNTAWEFGEEATEENLRTHIKKLRKILGKEMIRNIRKHGYLLAVS